MEITETHARKVLEVVEAGLVSGLGVREPGRFCVEAAVCYALGLPHGDDPQCVSQALRALKIRLNDSRWSSNEARANGLRRLAVAQLGSAGVLDEKKFVKRIVDYAIRVSTPKALRIAAGLQRDPAHKAALLSAANRCEVEGTKKSADAAASAAYAAAAYASASAAADASSADASAAADASSADAAYAADAAASAAAAYASANDRDKSLAEYAEAIVQILIELNAPGCQWLPLTEAA